MKNNPLTLIELQNLISSTINRELNEYYWITAEISELKTNYSGHNYLELTDKHKSSDLTTAKIKGIIWSRQARFLLPFFETSTGIQLGEGLSVLIRGKLEYHAIYGLSFIISDIDPGYTIGDVARKRNEIINRLTSEGVIGMNGELDLPLHPRRIAVISSAEAAGYEDFLNQLHSNPYSYKYSTSLFSSVMQGNSTSNSVLNAFEEISNNIDDFDIVIIVRGGGSASDLSWFDDYDIAFMVSQFPIPVISGIGHERDSSVTDIVAHTSCKTPTATADFLIELSAETERYLISLRRGISSNATLRLSEARRILTRLGSAFILESRLLIKNRRQKLVLHAELIKSGSKYFIANNKKHASNIFSEVKASAPLFIDRNKKLIEQLNRSIKHLSPYMVLKRGYSISFKDGKIISSMSDLSKGDKITSQISDGSFTSEIFDIKE